MSLHRLILLWLVAGGRNAQHSTARGNVTVNLMNQDFTVEAER